MFTNEELSIIAMCKIGFSNISQPISDDAKSFIDIVNRILISGTIIKENNSERDTDENIDAKRRALLNIYRSIMKSLIFTQYKYVVNNDLEEKLKYKNQNTNDIKFLETKINDIIKDNVFSNRNMIKLIQDYGFIVR